MKLIYPKKFYKSILKGYSASTPHGLERLALSNGIIEHMTTIHYLEKYLPKNGVVADIGSDPGRYSLWFAQHGYGRLTACRFLKKRKRNIAQWL